MTTMIEKTDILRRIDPASYYGERLQHFKRNGGPEASALCPFHEDTNPSFSVNVETGLWLCHACGEKGDLLAFEMKRSGVPFRDALRALASLAGLPDDPRIAYASGKEKAKHHDAVEQWARVRGFQVEVLQEFGADDESADVIRLPMRDNTGLVVGWSRRRADNGLLPGGKAMTAKGTKNGLFFAPPLAPDGVVLVVEGGPDALAAMSAEHMAVIGTPGLDPSRASIGWLQRLCRNRNVILVPQQEAAAEKWRDRMGGALRQVQAEVRYAVLPAGKKDLDEALRFEPDRPAVLKDLLDSALAWVHPKGKEASLRRLANFEEIEVEDTDGKSKVITVAIHIPEISNTLATLTDSWPRRTGNLMFVDENGVIRFLEDRNALFALLQERVDLFWKSGSDACKRSFVARAEFYEHLAATVENYQSVEAYPHEPQLPGHYYAWKAPPGYTPRGEHLGRLLAFFDNPETPEDFMLIRAMFMTPAWGGSPGRRPAFVILADDRGFGKTTLAGSCGDLYGGAIDLGPNEDAEERLVSRLLTPSALTRRVVRMDNLKGIAESALVESLITTSTISGHRLYHGEATRPNHLVFVVTGNSLTLSRDLAERAFIIRLRRPEYRAQWEAEVSAYMTAHRDEILADVVAALGGRRAEVRVGDRYAEWASQVLARVTNDPDAVLQQNQRRRQEGDADLDDAGAIEAALVSSAQEIARSDGGAAGGGGEVFITSTRVAEILCKALGERLSARAVHHRVQGHIAAGRLPRTRYQRNASARGYLVQLGESK